MRKTEVEMQGIVKGIAELIRSVGLAAVPLATLLGSFELAMAGADVWAAAWLIAAILFALVLAAAVSPPVGRIGRPAPPTSAPKGPAPTPPPGR